MEFNQEPPGSPEPDQSPAPLDIQVNKVPAQQPPKVATPDIMRDREKARTWLAKALVVSSITTVFATFLLIAVDRVSFYVFKEKPPDDGLAKDLITLIWTAQTALVGSALGFYFGDRDSQ